MLDKQTKREIAQVVNDAIQRALEKADDRWITGAELCNQFQCFTPSWLKIYGKYLTRTQIIMVDEDGNEQHSKTWVYPQRKIQRMIAENKLKFIIKNENQRQQL